MSNELIAAVVQAGIVGAGGAGFPTHVKLNAKADTVIINGAECEPFLTSDYRLMLEQPEQVLIGAKIMMKALDVTKCRFGVEENKPEAIAAMEKAFADIDRGSVFLV